MTMQELATAVCYDVPVINAVLNNGWLGMVRQWQELFHDERYSETDLLGTMPDYVKLAEAFGCAGLPGRDRGRGRRRDHARPLECGGPCVIDFRVDREEKVYPMVPAGAASSDMIDDEPWDNEWVEEGV